jgi:cyclopropane-fatty-acyl-phospholipid synthase
VGLWSLEHGRAAYRADFAVHGLLAGAMALALLAGSPAGQGAWLAALAAAGVAFWSLAEYLLHRFVLHGVRPFVDWHAEHHRRPAALIGLPTAASTGLIAVLVLLPAWALGGAWVACAFGFGVVAGYLGYTCAHHVVHHGQWRSAWVLRRRRMHALHHAVPMQPGQRGVNFGVTSTVWDALAGTRRRWLAAGSGSRRGAGSEPGELGAERGAAHLQQVESGGVEHPVLDQAVDQRVQTHGHLPRPR